ncbi:MAG: HD domain-containing protein [Clostridiaceae bacterium]|nr:HD domain-containing protein [Clostridiaceae bacterium]
MSIKQLKDINKDYLNQTIELVVLLSEVKVKTTKADKRYAEITIQDASKMTEAKYWDYEENEAMIKNFKSHEIIRVKLQIGEYQGQLQLTIKEIKKAEDDSITIKNFIPTSSVEYESMEKGLKYFYDRVEAPHLKELLDKMIFCKEYYEKFCTYVAAKKVHHNFYHGLLQHTLEVLKFVNTVANTKKLSQKQIDRLIVMTMLHDWGKMMEYKALPDTGLTEEGIMIGHIFLGAHYTLSKIEEIQDFNIEDKLVVLNGILGHHGSLEFGSPVLPKSIEAQILHQADKMSGDIESILSFMNEDTDEDEAFTKKLWNMGTEYYKK